MMEPALRIDLPEIPFCPRCGRVLNALGWHEVTDGARLILTNFVLPCQRCGHQVPVRIENACVDALRPAAEQIQVRVGTDRRS